jgi:hypothetical protein
MEQTATDPSQAQTIAQQGLFSVALEGVAHTDLPAPLPTDQRQNASFVASRATVVRRPPALALILSKRQTEDAQATSATTEKPTVSFVRRGRFFETTGVDLGPIAALQPDVLAWRLTDLFARLSERPDLVGNPSALAGLGRLNLQTRMLEHIHILQSAAAEGIA